MKKIFAITLIFLFVFAIFSPVFAQERYHTFGRNPVVRGGLSQPAPGTMFVRTPQDFSQVRMWGASGESSVKTLPAGTVVEARIIQNMFVGQRVVCCGNKITPIKWPVGQIQGQQYVQQIIVNAQINFIQPTPKPDLALYMNSKMQGAMVGQTRYVNVGGVSKQTVTWTDVNNKVGNFDNSTVSSSVANGGQGGNATSTIGDIIQHQEQQNQQNQQQNQTGGDQNTDIQISN